MTRYVLHAEGGSYAVTGGASRGTVKVPDTGREVEVGPGYALAEEWLAYCSDADRVHLRFEEKFTAELRSAVAVSYAKPLFRGRRDFNSPPVAPVSPLDFGPNPKKSRQRYNWEGIGALYLCDSVLGVIGELGAPDPGYELWTQEFLLPRTLKLFDGAGVSPSSFMSAVFLLVERQREPERERPALGARIGDIVRAANFDGMIVPGVRGKRAKIEPYSNVVVFEPGFEPESPWTIWVAASAASSTRR